MGDPTKNASKPLSRALDALLDRGAGSADFNYRVDDPAMAGEAMAEVFREDLGRGVSRQTLLLSTRVPGFVPTEVASLSRVVFSEAGGRVAWGGSEPTARFANGADPAMAQALCEACAEALAPKAPSLLGRLLGRREPASDSAPSARPAP